MTLQPKDRQFLPRSGMHGDAPSWRGPVPGLLGGCLPVPRLRHGAGFALASAVGFGLAMVADRSQRRACGACGHRARVEAVRCPSCQRALEPRVWLTPPPRMSRHVEALFAEPPKAKEPA